VIGGFEAQAIAVAIEGMVPNRPLTHDLFKNTLDIFHVELKEVIINNLLEGVFYARLICLKDGEIVEIDSRTSDALALAVRFSAPIYTYEFILDAAGVELHDSGDEEEEAYAEMEPTSSGSGSKAPRLSDYRIDELEQLLEDVLNDEDYEQAARIRDEINRRKSS
jgi:bifunctional DNase/RNase